MSDLALQNISARATFNSLPSELLSLIAAHLDPSSACAFARISRSCTSPADSGVWRYLNFSLPEHYGEIPQPLPRAPLFGGRNKEWENEEAQKAEELHRAALKVKIDSIIELADKGRYGYVRSVSLKPRPEAVKGILGVLELVSPNLQRLEILPPTDELKSDEHAWSRIVRKLPKHDHETLDHGLIESSLHFPMLSHLRIVGRVLYFEDVIPLLCRSSPNLISLDIEFQPQYIPSAWRSSKPSSFLLDHETKLEVLSIVLHNQCYKISAQGMQSRSTDAIISILGHSPRLRHLDVRYIQGSYQYDCAFSTVVDKIKGLALLQDLSWRVDTVHSRNGSASQGRKSLETSQGTLPVRRLVFRETKEWMDVFVNLPGLPHLKVLGIAKCHSESPISPINTSDVHLAQRPHPTFAAQIRRCPNLSIIHTIGGFTDHDELDIFAHLDQSKSRGDITGRVSSLQCGKSGDLIIISIFAIGLGSLAKDTAADDPLGKWGIYTDFKGYTVPLIVIEKMREVEGASESDWEGRGVEVGKAAWQVLLDWKKYGRVGKPTPV